MKHTLLLLATASALMITACREHEHAPENDKDNGDKNCIKVHKYHHKPHSDYDSSANYITLDSGNKMISSYLNSIDYKQNDTDLYELIYNADSLRSYLADKNVVGIKFMLAHTLDYINNGGQDQYAGYQAGALTMVIAGYDVKGNYVFYYYPKSFDPMALDHCSPCPSMCPTGGTASSDFLVPNENRKR